MINLSTNWISVEDKPKKEGNYIVCNNATKQVGLAWFGRRTKKDIPGFYMTSIKNITHWTELP